MSVFVVKAERYQVMCRKSGRLLVSAETLEVVVGGIIEAKRRGCIVSGLGGVYVYEESFGKDECKHFWDLYNTKIEPYLVDCALFRQFSEFPE